jgi:hypothetical protein
MSNHILNPKTQRLIKIGGKVYQKLVAEGILEKVSQEHELFESETKEEALVAKKILTKQNKDPTRSVKLARNGKTVIKAKKRMTHQQISQNMGKASTNVIKKIGMGKIIIPDEIRGDDIEEFIQSEILKELMNLKVGGLCRAQDPNIRNESPDTREPKSRYTIQDPESESESESSSESEVDIDSNISI